MEESRLKATEAALRRRFSGEPRFRIVLEAGLHSPWISRLLVGLGHEVRVANPRRLRAIYENENKSDRVDAEYLARIGRLDPALLHPLRHRSLEVQADLAVLRSRTTLVRARATLVNHLRGTVESIGGRLPRCGTRYVAERAALHLPPEAIPALSPVLSAIAELTVHIAAYDKEIERMAKERYPETELLRQVPGVEAMSEVQGSNQNQLNALFRDCMYRRQTTNDYHWFDQAHWHDEPAEGYTCWHGYGTYDDFDTHGHGM